MIITCPFCKESSLPLYKCGVGERYQCGWCDYNFVISENEIGDTDDKMENKLILSVIGNNETKEHENE